MLGGLGVRTRSRANSSRLMQGSDIRYLPSPSSFCYYTMSGAQTRQNALSAAHYCPSSQGNIKSRMPKWRDSRAASPACTSAQAMASPAVWIPDPGPHHAILLPSLHGAKEEDHLATVWPWAPARPRVVLVLLVVHTHTERPYYCYPQVHRWM